MSITASLRGVAGYLNWPARILLSASTLWWAGAAGAASLALRIDDIIAPEFTAQGIELLLPLDGSAHLNINRLQFRQQKLQRVRLQCSRFEFSTAALACRGGRISSLPGFGGDLTYRFDARSWRVALRLQQAPMDRLTVFLPAAWPQPTKGRLDGVMEIAGDAAGGGRVATDLRLTDLAFSDAAGLHAAEKLRGGVKLSASRGDDAWQWNAALDWDSGELYWQPLYLAGSDGRHLGASGRVAAGVLTVEQAQLVSPSVGVVEFAGQWDGTQSRLLAAELHGDGLALQPLFADYLRPFFGSVLAEATLSGQADLAWRYRGGKTEALHLALHDAGMTDAQHRFAVHGLNTAFAWSAEVDQAVPLSFAGGELLHVPFGKADWTLRLRAGAVGLMQGAVPVLGGNFELRDFRLWRADGDWRWQFGAALSRVSMEQFSVAAGWPKMLGMLAGRIPRVVYDGDEIRIDGALLFELFDGTAVASQLRLRDPFGPAPRLNGNLSMRGLDLDLLTRTFSFGSMQGRIDAEVLGLELQNWQPAAFDARIASSNGNYPKKISQRAVQNISALGGAGAAAAIQRSYLGFFENFGYDRIGWRCRLHNGVCAMGGIDDGNGSAYAIVKGGGIPAITVMGYNRAVSWDELVSRLKRVTQGNMQAVVK